MFLLFLSKSKEGLISIFKKFFLKNLANLKLFTNNGSPKIESNCSYSFGI